MPGSTGYNAAASAPASVLHGVMNPGSQQSPEGGSERSDPWIFQMASSLAIEARTLAEFRLLMSQQGFRLEMSRFFLDLVYAYRQLAIAHSVGNVRLKALALELFEACQQLDQRRRHLSEVCRHH